MLKEWCAEFRALAQKEGITLGHTIGNPNMNEPIYHYGSDWEQCPKCPTLGISHPGVLKTIHDRFMGNGGLGESSLTGYGTPSDEGPGDGQGQVRWAMN